MTTAHPITQNPQKKGSNLWQRAHRQILFCGLQQNEKLLFSLVYSIATSSSRPWELGISVFTLHYPFFSMINRCKSFLIFFLKLRKTDRGKVMWWCVPKSNKRHVVLKSSPFGYAKNPHPSTPFGCKSIAHNLVFNVFVFFPCKMKPFFCSL